MKQQLWFYCENGGEGHKSQNERRNGTPNPIANISIIRRHAYFWRFREVKDSPFHIYLFGQLALAYLIYQSPISVYSNVVTDEMSTVK